MARMKLQRSISRRIGGREYVKHQVVIPNNIVDILGWSPGDRLEGKTAAKGLLIYRIGPRQPIEKPSYEQFEQAVTNILTTVPKGCTWSELRLKAGLNQLTPSPIWVKRMEHERGLQRILNRTTSQLVWRLPEEYLSSSSRSTLNGWTAKRRD